MPAPAVGWIKELAVRDGAIWGRVEWNAEGAAAVTSRAYRYLSPVFTFSATTREIDRIVSVGLTNSPNLEMAALNAAEQKETADMVDPTILEALGLKPTADVAATVLAINSLKETRQTALNSAQSPDPAKFVPIADHQLALNRIASFEAEDKTRAEAEIETAINSAIEAGKIAPSSRDFHMAACRAEGGLERFRSFVSAAPVIVKPSGLDGKRPMPGDLALNAEEKAAAIALGISFEDYAKAKEE
jgi:phage I-like protein